MRAFTHLVFLNRLFKFKARTQSAWVGFFIVLFLSFQSFAMASSGDHQVMVVIDTSGSMIKNDPQNLRRPAVRLVTQMLPQKTQSGLWIFDGKTKNLVPFGEVNDSWKQETARQADNIHSKGQWTNIESTLKLALKTFSKEASSKTLLLLTDGQVDISKDQSQNNQSKQRMLNTLLPLLQKENIQFHGLALSQQADKDLLQRLAVGTNGLFSIAQNADELMGVFLQAFDQTIETDQVPLNDNTFQVDASVQEFTVLVFRNKDAQASELISPSGQTFTSSNQGESKWYSDHNYDLITLSKPQAGAWKLNANLDPSNRVTVVSNLELMVDGLPNNIIQGQEVKLQFSLNDSKGIIQNTILLSLLDISFEQNIFGDNPQTLKAKVTSHSEGKIRTPKDGVYTANLSKTLLPGEHEFKVMVDGKTFQRQQTKRARVFANVLEAIVVPGMNDQGEALYSLTLVPIQGLTDPNSLEINGSLRLPSGKILPVDLAKSEFGAWSISVPASEGKAIYKVFVSVKGKSSNGQKFSVKQGPFIVDYSKTIEAMNETSGDLFDELLDQGTLEDQAQKQAAIEVIEPPVELSVKPSQEAAAQPPIQPKVKAINQAPADVVEEESRETSDFEAMDDEVEGIENLDEDAMLDEEAMNDDKELAELASNEPESEAFLSKKMMIILAAIIGNLLLCGAGFFGYRRFIRKARAAAEAEDKALLEGVEKAQKKVKPLDKPKVATPDPEPVEDELTNAADEISHMLDELDVGSESDDPLAS